MIRELSDEVDKSRMDGRERETVLINDLTKCRGNLQELKEELRRTQDKMAAKMAEMESVIAENEVYAKEVSAIITEKCLFTDDVCSTWLSTE